MTLARPSSLRALARRHRWVLCLTASLTPIVLLAGASWLGGAELTDLVTVPLAGGRIGLWLVLAGYAGLTCCPLLAWSHAEVEWSASRFRSTALLFPHGLALLVAALTVVLLAATGPGRIAVFWVVAAVALAAASTALLGELGWIGSLVGGLVAIDQVGQGRLVVYRSEQETLVVVAVWLLAQSLCLIRAARRHR